ncbi:hypothetical protein IAT38_003614 [Cryptococcus sp. DSM 104549]
MDPLGFSTSVNGLKDALTGLRSEKIKDRQVGYDAARDILGNRESILTFHRDVENAGVNNGWSHLFEVFFCAYKYERRLYDKNKTNAPAGKRLEDAMKLIRMVSEQAVHFFNRQTVLFILGHMRHQLVVDSRIFDKAAYHYPKAIHRILSYPPHLEVLNRDLWISFMGMCWAALLEDDVLTTRESEELEDPLEIVHELKLLDAPKEKESEKEKEKKKQKRSEPLYSSQVQQDTVSLIPLLLDSSSAPLLQPVPRPGDPALTSDKVGLGILLKTRRYLEKYPDGNGPCSTSLFAALNRVLAEMELSTRADLVFASLALLPQLVVLWGMRGTQQREQVAIALRTILPYITHRSLVDAKQAAMVREQLEKVMEGMPKEIKATIVMKEMVNEPLPLEVVRLRTAREEWTEVGSFELRAVAPGFGFGRSHALRWAVLEVYRDCWAYLYQTRSSAVPPTPSRNGGPSKRRKVENVLQTLLSGISSSDNVSYRLLSLQLLIFIVDRHWSTIAAEGQSDIRRALLDILEEDDSRLQSWAYIALSTLAIMSQGNEESAGSTDESLVSPTSRFAQLKALEGDWARVWSYAMRKLCFSSTCRAASHAAAVILQLGAVDRAVCMRDLQAMLQNLDYQGPIFPYDSVCVFFSIALESTRADIRLYSLELENQVLAWLEKCKLVEGPRGKGWLEQQTPAVMLHLLSVVARHQHHPLVGVTTGEVLPDSAIVSRVLEEASTKPIRDFALHHVFPAQPSSSTFSATSMADAAPPPEQLVFLDGRPRRISNILTGALQSVIAEWTPPPPVAAGERPRRCLDLVVLSLAFQSSLQLNGSMPDAACTQAALQLLHAILPAFTSSDLPLTGKHLLWRGFEPLADIPGVKDAEADWPIQVKPDAQSGIRQDLLPPERYDTYRRMAKNGRGTELGRGATPASASEGWKYPTQLPPTFPPTPITPSMFGAAQLPQGGHGLVRGIWQLAGVATALEEVSEICCHAIEQWTVGQSASREDDEDDPEFAVSTADFDAMPATKDSLECSRTSTSLLRTLVGFRLKGAMLANVYQRASRDTGLINTFLNAEGSRAIEIGQAITDAVQRGWLRLTKDAVTKILEYLHDMLSSYTYIRDPALQQLCIDFVHCSTNRWMEPDSELEEMAMKIVCWASVRVQGGMIGSWRVRIALLRLLDDFIHEESAAQLWDSYQPEKEDEDEDMEDGGVRTAMTRMLSDVDMRVRVRAATSVAAAFYRPLLPSADHVVFYEGTANSLPQSEVAEFTLSHILWAVNCCISSARVRSNAIYYLVDVNDLLNDFAPYVQPCLEVTARQLGLSSIEVLYAPYAPHILFSLLQNGSFAMKDTHLLYGFSSRRSYAAACLEWAAPTLAAGNTDFLLPVCDAAGVPVADAVTRYFPAAAAAILAYFYHDAKVANTGSGDQTESADTASKSGGLVRLEEYTQLCGKEAKAMLKEEAEGVVGHLWEVMDLDLDVSEVAALVEMSSKGKGGAKVFKELMANDESPTGDAFVKKPSAAARSIFTTLDLIKRNAKSMNQTKMVFSSIIRLAELINNTYLISEQQRQLRALAIVVALFQEEFRHPTILRAFLLEMLAILHQPDICGVAMSMVAWGFGQIKSLGGRLPDLTNLFIQLGAVRGILGKSPPGDNRHFVGAGLEEWIVETASSWGASERTRGAFETSLALWPEELRQRVSESYVPDFHDLCSLAENPVIHNGAQLCKQYLQLTNAEEGERERVVSTFIGSSFWHLKDKLSADADEQGIEAFLELLYLGSGQVHAPSIKETSGMTGPSSVLRWQRDPERELRAAMVMIVARLTNDVNHRTRAAAYHSLKAMIPVVSADMPASSSLSSEVVDQLSVLTPTNLAGSGTGKAATLKGVINSGNWIKNARSVDQWARDLVSLLCDVASAEDPFYRALQPLISTPHLALRNFLPHLTRAVLTCGFQQRIEDVMLKRQALSEHFTMVLQWPSTSLDTIQSILSIVLHLRLFPPPYREDKQGHETWLDVDFLVLSSAAVRCGAYATSLMFLELARDQERADIVSLSDPKVQKIMYEIYSNIEDPDGFYGIENHNVYDSLLRRLKHEGQSWRALGWSGAAVEAGRAQPASLLPVLQNLHHIGFDHLASAVASHSRPDEKGDRDDPFFCELAWRTGDWDMPLPAQVERTPEGLLYSALRAVHRERDRMAALKVVNRSIQLEVARLGSLSMEMTEQIKSTATNLLCLREAVRWLDPQVQGDLEGGRDSGVIEGFSQMSQAFEFSNAEKITATRLSLLQSTRQHESKDTIGDLLSPKMVLIDKVEKACRVNLSSMALKNGNVQAAINSITAVQTLESTTKLSDQAEDVFFQVLWVQGEHALAITQATGMVEQVQARKPKDAERHATLMGRMAHYTALAKLKSAEEIKGMFDRAVAIGQSSKVNIAERARISHDYACFAESHYATLSKSPELESLRAAQRRKGGSRQSLSSQRDASRLGRENTEALDEELTLEKLEKQEMEFLRVALRLLAEAIATSDLYNDSVSRLISLWLENDLLEDINVSFANPLVTIPSHKFVFFGPQLASRLHRSTAATTFQSILHRLILRICRDHPYHLLYDVITLAYSVTHPSEFAKSSERDKNPGRENRARAAAGVLEALKSGKEASLGRRAAKDMGVFVTAAMQACVFPAGQGKGSELPPSYPILNPPSGLPVITRTPPIDLACLYKDIPTMTHYGKKYDVAGGVHKVKILKVTDTRGQEHKELFKSDDEVRQDAVMEQVFVTVNQLLSREHQAKARRLNYRTYQVVPLPLKNGVIQFVGGAAALGEVFKRCHSTHGQGDAIQSSEITKKYMVQDSGIDCLPLFLEIMSKFPPAFRHFFTDKKRDPMAWFAMRLNYSRSLAVTSFVGWVLGIGDRHCTNVMIDQSSGELLHIDFGITFEAGRFLRVPETVPFRLTHELVDGLGITGIEGTFRRCSEHTLLVLQQSSDILMTVLEVFKHDPLHSWASQEKMEKAQKGAKAAPQAGQEIGREKAEKIVGKIKSKLGKDVHVEYRVNQLIQEAMDPENLARIYRGWQPWF